MNTQDFAKLLLGNNSSFPLAIEYALSDIPKDEPMHRNHMARILHVYLRDVLMINDISDKDSLKRAEKIQDLFDCRVCVNDIMQVYLRDIMKVKYDNEEAALYAFGVHEVATKDEIKEALLAVQGMLGTFEKDSIMQ